VITNIKQILVPTDFSETADAALAYATGLASELGATIRLVHVFSDPYTLATYVPEVYAPVPPDKRERALEDVQKQLQARLGTIGTRGVTGTGDIVTGLTAQQIVNYATTHAIDLIVIGTHGRRGVAHLLLGSVAEHVVRISSCPVLTVRASDSAVGDRASEAVAAAHVA
jgi:universal stress protein A